MPEGNATLLAIAPPYVASIMNPNNSTFPILKCPAIDQERYNHLRVSAAPKKSEEPHYYFALNLRSSAAVIPRLLSSIVEAMKFLGPENCALSIIVGISPDGTYEILKELEPEIKNLGARYYLVSSALDSKTQDRILTLAKLRNLALEPFHGLPAAEQKNSTVIFLNDISLCSEDILELVHQKRVQTADMTCAMDWYYAGPDNPTFYDVWIARGINGDTFFEIPPNGSWDHALDLFWNDPHSKEKQLNSQPFQVFACWNGIVTFSAEVLEKVKFRVSGEGECFQGEPQLFCKDMWYHNFGKIAVIPSVNVEYSDENSSKLKKLKGYVSELVAKGASSEKITWQIEPPKEVKCMPNYESQHWAPWNQLAEKFSGPL
jgi:alpha-1,3-mannosyltransferase